MEGDCSGRTSVSLNRRHLEKAHWLWSRPAGPSSLVSHLFLLYAEIKPFSSSSSSFISPSEMTGPTRPATFYGEEAKLIITASNFLRATLRRSAEACGRLTNQSAVGAVRCVEYRLSHASVYGAPEQTVSGGGHNKEDCVRLQMSAGN